MSIKITQTTSPNCVSYYTLQNHNNNKRNLNFYRISCRSQLKFSLDSFSVHNSLKIDSKSIQEIHLLFFLVQSADGQRLGRLCHEAFITSFSPHPSRYVPEILIKSAVLAAFRLKKKPDEDVLVFCPSSRLHSENP